MVCQVLSGVFGDVARALTGWARAHPVAALGLATGWWGIGRLGAGAAKALLPRSAAGMVVLLGPPLLVWAALRRTKSGRHGIVAAGPVLAGLLVVGMWVYAPASRKVWVFGGGVFLLLAAVTAFDEWLGGRSWSLAAVREAYARDDAHHAFRAGVQAVAPGSRVSRPVRSGAGWVSDVSVPAGATPETVRRAADDETLGAAASASGVPLSEVAVGRGRAGAQGQVVVHGTVAGQPHPLDAQFAYPHGGDQ